MSLFPIFSRRPKSQRRANPMAPKARPVLEVLEDRCLPSANVISGFVYVDANNNGLFDPGEAPIANSSIQLRNAQNQVVASTITDANGFYKFDHDDTISQNPATLTKTVTFPSTQTDFTLPGLVDQFDPSLGQLQSVDIIHNGSISSEIKVENTSPVSTSTINGTVGGSLHLVAPGVDSTLNISQNVGSFNATIYDGLEDYNGTSGHSFGVQTASGTKTITLIGAAINAYIGTGQITATENAQAASFASGGGNLAIKMQSTGMSNVTVVYHYIPSNALKPGPYTIIQTVQPQGFLDGKESSGGVVLGNPPGTDFIPVTLVNTDVPNNNFGELQTAGVSGYVYHDANNDGTKDPTEAGIQGVLITLTGVGNSGPVTKTAVTNPNGFYQILGLDPGTYTLQETQPAAYLDGKDTAGSLGGTVTNDQIANIVLGSGANSTDNNFGELKAGSLSGYVYADANNNGTKDPGEIGIAGVTVTLTGFDPDGPALKNAVTDQNGLYGFGNLKLGNYVITETQPANYNDGQDAIGSQGGQAGNDVLSGIVLGSGVDGIHNNFGELGLASLSGYVYADGNNNGAKDPAEAGIANIPVTLTGSDTDGPVLKSAVTDQNGLYSFGNLKTGNYVITETQPANYFDGQDAIGSQGGQAGNDVLSGIALGAAVDGINNNFGELAPAGLSGNVYVDSNNNGSKDPGEAGIPNTTVTLTGIDGQGPVLKTAVTDASGFYRFQDLRPGNYAITETQPANYNDGKDTIGSAGGIVANDNFSGILLGAGILGTSYNFGELLPEVADLGIVKTASAYSVLVGGTLNYTLTVTNYGTYTAQNVQVQDTLPPDALLLSVNAPGWTAIQGPGMIIATLPSLAVGASAQIFVSIKVPAVSTTMVNTSTVTASTPDNNPTNNTSTVTTLVINKPGDTFSKTITPLAIDFGNIRIPGKLGLFSFDPTPYLDPVSLGQQAFVDGTIRTLLGRGSDYTEMTNWVTQLQGGMTRDQFVAAIWNSDEHLAYQAKEFYQVFYDRSPAPFEQAFVAQELKSGMSEVDVALAFLTSAEYAALHPTATTLVAGFYQDILNRLPDLSTSLQMVQALGAQTTTSVALALLTSSEGLADIVDDGYRAILRRPATTGEIQYWVGQMQAQFITPGQLMQKLLTSDEFYTLAYNSIK